MPTGKHTRREVLRRIGLAGAIGFGMASPFSGSVVASATSSGDSDSSHSTHDTTINSFDGTDIAATEYRPSGEGPFPSVLITHGWANDRKTEGPTALANLYANHGYFVLTYDSRGFGASGGLVGVDGEDEIKDAQRLITYLANHEAVQSDGDDPTVGMDGFSYAAGIQLRTAAADDRLDAIIPRWAWHDLRFSNDPNGVIKWPWFYALNISGLTGSLGLIPDASRGRDANKDGVPDLEQEFLELGQEALGSGTASDELREFWASKSPGPQNELAEIEAPTLLIHGWHDRLFTPNEAFANYRGIRNGGTEARLLMYDGGHDLVPSSAPGDNDPEQQRFLAGAALGFFRRHLKDESETAQLSPVTFYRDRDRESASGFESYADLPDGERTFSIRDSAGPGTTRLRTGPGGANTATFDFNVADPFELVGAGELTVRVTPRGGRPILSAALAKVAGDGTATPLKDQIAVTPIEGRGNTTVSLDLIGTEASFAAGDTLRLILGVSDDNIAPVLTDEIIFGAIGDPADLRQGPVGEYIPETVPSTDGLYFDSPEDPPTGVVIQHTRPGDSVVTVQTLASGTNGAADSGRGQTQRQQPSLPQSR